MAPRVAGFDAHQSQFGGPLSLFDQSRTQAPLSLAERTAFRFATAHRELPRIAWAMAIVTAFLVLLNSTVGAYASFSENLPVALSAVVLAVVAAVGGRAWVPAAVVPWLTAAVATMLVAALTFQEAAYQSPTGLAYALLVIVSYGPVTLSYRAAAAAAIPIAVCCSIAASHFGEDAFLEWVLVVVAALLIDFVLLAMRISSIDALASAIAHERAMSTVDAMTGLLNRRGLSARAEQLVAWSRRHEMVVCATFIDVDGLKAANDQHGHEFGDQVIRATANAIGSVVRADDLVARWGGDEFVVLSIGSSWDADEITARIDAALTSSGISAAQWPGTVTAGTATTDLGHSTLDALVSAADIDMYRRRAQARGR